MTGPDRIFYKWGGGVGADFPEIADAYDEFLVTEDGREIVDAAAGAAVVNLGHSIPGIDDVVRSQLSAVSYLSLSHFTHDAPRRLAETLADMAPGDLNAAFFVNSGSEATETAIKFARAYHRATGNPEKHLVVGRERSYHGSTLGALSASGATARRAAFEPLLQEWPHIPAAYPYRWSYEGSAEEGAVAAARELETVVRREGAERVAAFVAEPVSGASIPAAHPHPAYFREIRRICDAYDVLFVADEVMTGFGRTGSMFAIEHFDVVPDVLTVGKGLSGGYAPISAAIVKEELAEVFGTDADASFAHGHTYGGNPLSAAIAAHVVELYTDSILETGRERGVALLDGLDSLREHPMVGDLRHCGPMIGLEFVSDRATAEPFDPEMGVAERVYEEALDRDVYTYPGTGSVDGVRGDHLMLAPPLTIGEEAVEFVAEAVIDAVEAVWEDESVRSRA